MMRGIQIKVLVLLAFFLFGKSACADIAEKFSQLHSLSKTITDAEFQNSRDVVDLEMMYFKLFAEDLLPEKLKKESTADLNLLFDATDMTNFYVNSDALTQNLKNLITELNERHAVSDEQTRTLYKVLVSKRLFFEANELSDSRPDLSFENLPNYIGLPSDTVNSTTALVFDPKNHSMTRKYIDLHDKTQVIVIFHPLCHFSLNAMRAIYQDPALGSRLIGKMSLLVPEDRTTKFSLFEKWNAAYPEIPLAVMYSKTEWPMFDELDTPTFYFFSNGIVKAKVVGWPTEGRKLELLNALDLVGL